MTVSTTSTICIKYYFNSHPHEEDDRKCLIFYFKTEIFQLTSSRRGWQYTLYFLFNCVNISTHILTKRMTSLHCSPFSPRTFQLTSSRRGWRRYGEYVDMDNQYFNSHPHEEDDSVSRFLNPSLYISTHILTKRMTTQPILSSTRY